MWSEWTADSSFNEYVMRRRRFDLFGLRRLFVIQEVCQASAALWFVSKKPPPRDLSSGLFTPQSKKRRRSIRQS